MQTAHVKYKDFWFKIIGCLLASYIIDALDRQETIFERLRSKYFYTDIAGGFVIALILWEIVRFITRYLDKRMSWSEQPVKRLLLQVSLGVVLPSLLSFVFTWIWMESAYNQDIFKTSWLNNEFYTVILIIVLINLIYFTWWLYLNWKQQSAFALLGNPASHTETMHKTIEVSKAGKTILLPQTDIAYCFLSNGYCYIKPFEGDVFVTSYTLDEVTRILGEFLFFRVNRQFLVSRKSCTAYKSIENGKIELDLIPPFKTPVIVSQKRARDFRKWVSAAIAEL
jgi:uncharacterized protein YacL